MSKGQTTISIKSKTKAHIMRNFSRLPLKRFISSWDGLISYLFHYYMQKEGYKIRKKKKPQKEGVKEMDIK